MKQVLIVFPDEWVAYSPTVLNMVSALSSDFEVTVLAFENGLYDNYILWGRKLHFYKAAHTTLASTLPDRFVQTAKGISTHTQDKEARDKTDELLLIQWDYGEG